VEQKHNNQSRAGHGGRRVGAGSGGRRPGSGRPFKKTSQTTAELRDAMVNQIAPLVPHLIELLYGMAKNGDRAAAEILIARAVGRVPEPITASTESQGYDFDLGHPPENDPAHNPDQGSAGVLG
jgi:hypothetical protein